MKLMQQMLMAISVVMMSVVVTSAQEQSRFDGNWWNNKLATDQLNVVVGLVIGRDAGAADVRARVSVDFDLPACREPAAESYRRVSRYTQNTTMGQVRDGLTEFYRDYRNRSILIPFALDGVLRAINGENVDSLVERFRKDP